MILVAENKIDLQKKGGGGSKTRKTKPKGKQSIFCYVCRHWPRELSLINIYYLGLGMVTM